MPSTISKDIYGTVYSLGYDSSGAERVVRRHFVEGATSLSGAISDVVANVGDFATVFPGVSTMPLQNVVAKQIGVGRYIVEQIYGWSGSGSWGGSDYNTLAEFRLGYESIQCYTVASSANPIQADGMPPPRPAGSSVLLKDSARTNDAERRPQPYSFNRPVLRIGVPKLSNANPMTANVVACMNKVNTNPVIIAGLTFNAKQLRFDGGEFAARSNVNNSFQGTFTFTGSYSFKEQRLAFTTEWIVTNEEGLGTGDFVTAFGLSSPSP